MKKGHVLLFYAVIVFLSFTFSANISGYDNDLWARLIVGKHFFQTGSLMYNDILSYTPTHLWIDHEWGSSLVFYWILSKFGAIGLLELQTILLSLIFFIAIQVIKLRGESKPYNILFYFIAFYAGMYNLCTVVRCQMFSFVFTTLFLLILEYARLKNKRVLALIPLLIPIWNNLHGGVVVGIGLIVMYIIGEFLNKKEIKPYLIILAITIPLMLINPYGIKYFEFLFIANTMPRADIIEWWNIFHHYHITNYIPFITYCIFIWTIEIFTLKNIPLKNQDKTKLIILFTTFLFAIFRAKLVPLFIISSLCFVYSDFQNLTFISNYKQPKWLNKSIFALLIILGLSNILFKDISMPIVTFKKYPLKEIEFIRLNKLEGNLLTSFGAGSYATYKLYPQNLIYMDGRYEEVYNEKELQLLKNFSLAKENGVELLKEHHTDIIIMEKMYPAYLVLKRDWDMIYEGDFSAVFIPKGTSKGGYRIPYNDIKYYQNTHFLTDINFEAKNDK